MFDSFEEETRLGPAVVDATIGLAVDEISRTDVGVIDGAGVQYEGVDSARQDDASKSRQNGTLDWYSLAVRK
jgi:hypothetical protein